MNRQTTRAMGAWVALLAGSSLAGVAACGSHASSGEQAPEPAEDAGVDAPSTPAADAAVEAAGPPTVADELLGRDRDATFDAFVAAIEGLQIVSHADMARLGTTWAAQLAVTRGRFRAAVSALDVYYALLSLQRSYHDLHSELDLPAPATGKSAALTVPSGSVEVLPIEVAVDYSAGPTEPVYYVADAEPGVGASVGDRVVSVDGQPIAAFEQSLLEFTVGSSPEAWRLSVAGWLSYRFPSDLPVPPPGAVMTVGLTDASGEHPHTAKLTWAEPTRNEPPPNDPCTVGMNVAPNPDYQALTPELVGINACVYGTKTGRKIIRWFSFLYEFSDYAGGDAFVEENGASLTDRMTAMSYSIPEADLPFDGPAGPGQALDPVGMMAIELSHLVAYVHAAGDPPLLVDVRENGGGDFDGTLVAPFASRPLTGLATQILYGSGLRATPKRLAQAEAPGAQPSLAEAYLVAHPTAAASPLYAFICQTPACAVSEREVAPAAMGFAGPTTLLTGPGCVSSCDDFVATLHDNGLAKSVGMPTFGADSPVRVPLVLTLADGVTKVTLSLTVGQNQGPGGQVLEGNPTAVDTPIYTTAANAGDYLAAILGALGP